MIKNRLFPWACMSLLVLLLSACPSESLEAPGVDTGEEIVKDFSMEPNIRMAVYRKEEIKDGKQPKLTYGSLDAYFVTLGEVVYMVDWNDLADFKNLKRGEKLKFRGTGFLARKEKTGENFKVVTLHGF